MIITIIIIYSLIIRGLQRQKTIESKVRSDSSTNVQNTTGDLSKNSSQGSETLSDINKGSVNNQNCNLNINLEEDRLSIDKSEKANLCDIDSKEGKNNSDIDNKNDNKEKIETVGTDSDDEEGSLTDEEEFYNNVIFTKSAAFQSKRNSSTSQSSSLNSSSIISYDEWRSKRNSLRSQSSITSSDPLTDTPNSVINNRRLSEESNQSNRRWNYKSRRFGYRASLSKRRRTTGRYHSTADPFIVFSNCVINSIANVQITNFFYVVFKLCSD